VRLVKGLRAAESHAIDTDMADVRAELAARLNAAGQSTEDAARDIRVSRATLFRILSGGTPSLRTAALIERRYKIHMARWYKRGAS
jgi:transcriptional regulator with XRE-family HTH domain